MAKVHFLTVGAGDCTIIQHDSGRVSVIDICNGNFTQEKKRMMELMEALDRSNPPGNFAMCKRKTNPVEYLLELGVSCIWRFILTHPDMDHMDGLDYLASSIPIDHFWDNGARKHKPDFDGSPYKEADWERYENILKGREGTNVLSPLAGERFSFANMDSGDGTGHDDLHIAAPTKNLVSEANEAQDFNDCSYVLSFISHGRRIVLPGDSHDKSWEFIGEHQPRLVQDSTFLLAPHHGRKSSRDFSFLNWVNPKLSLLGCAESEHLAYDSWRSRGLKYHTQNQTGNLVLETGPLGIAVYAENKTFVQLSGGDPDRTNDQGYYFLTILF